MAVGVIEFTAGACGRKRPITLAVIPKTTATDYWENLHAGAHDAAAKLRYRLFWNAPQSETEYAQQATMVEAAIRRKIDGIILAPSHGTVLASSVRHAKAEGIPVVLVDSPVSASPVDYLAYIGSNETQIGRTAAMRIGHVLQGRGDIAMLGVSPTVEASVQREQSFLKTITAKFPHIRITDIRYGLSDHMRSREITRDIVSARPLLQALFASDSFAARGAFAALRDFRSRGIRLIAVAQEEDMVRSLASKLIDALVVQFPYEMGRRAVEVMRQAIQNSYHGPKVIETPIALATAENLHQRSIQQFVEKRPV